MLSGIYSLASSFLGRFLWGRGCVSVAVDSSSKSRFFPLSNSDVTSVLWPISVWLPPPSECFISVCDISSVLSVLPVALNRVMEEFVELWDSPSAVEARSLEACGSSSFFPFLPSMPSLWVIPVCSRKWSMRLFRWGLGRGWEVEVKGTPVKGSLGARPQVASLFWCSSSVLLSTDTPLGSSMGSVITSCVMGSRNSSGMDRLLESRQKI